MTPEQRQAWQRFSNLTDEQQAAGIAAFAKAAANVAEVIRVFQPVLVQAAVSMQKAFAPLRDWSKVLEEQAAIGPDEASRKEGQ